MHKYYIFNSTCSDSLGCSRGLEDGAKFIQGRALGSFVMIEAMRIEKKILPEYFELVRAGEKTYDFRLADFEISPGDTLVLKEWNKQKQIFTGRELEKEVTYVGRTKGDNTWSKEEIGKFGYQIISFK